MRTSPAVFERLVVVVGGGVLTLSALAFGVPPPPANSPPIVTIELPPNPGWFLDLERDDLVRIRITVTDPDGDPVSADLAASPTWHGFRPITNEPSGATRELSWRPYLAGGGYHDLVVRAHDAVDPATVVVATRSLLVLGSSASKRVLAHDFDRDGSEELLATVSFADFPGAVDAGALALFDRYGTGGFGPSPLLLTAAPPVAGRRLGDPETGDLLIADVTGDGREEVITCDRQSALVWSISDARGSTLTPIAVLRGSDPLSGFSSSGQSLLVHDFTGDGVLDLLAVASGADLGGLADVGEICLFAGGNALVGAPAPTARLQVPGAAAGDALGLARTGVATQTLLIADVTGDGIDDVVGAAPRADRGTVVDSGKVYVWDGATLAGPVAPRATLDAVAAKDYDSIGAGAGELRIVDLTGDGVQDVLVGGADVGSSGSWFLWRGGAALAGTLDANARLRTASAQANTSIHTILLRDFDRDGVLDLIALNSAESVAGVSGAGVVDYWRGGSHLSGLVFESATFRRVAPGKDDALGSHGMQLTDVTGDGVDDLLLVSPQASGAASRSGVITLFAGGGTPSGTILPSAELQVPGAAVDDRLGDPRSSLTRPACGMLVTDVTGDGVRDVLAVAPLADLGSLADVGAGYVWAGGAVLGGGAIVAPTAELRPPQPAVGAYLGHHDDGGCAIQCGDLDDDGIADVAVTTALFFVAPAQLLVFKGGASLVGTPTPLAAIDALQPDDRLGLDGDGCGFVDVDGDRRLDLVAHAPEHDRDPNRYVTNTGALHVLRGGPGVGSARAELRECQVASAGAGYYGSLLPPRDLDGDGVLDLRLLQPQATLSLGDDVGQVLLWRSAPPAGRGGSPGGAPGLKMQLPPPVLPPSRGRLNDPEIAAIATLGDGCRLGE